MSRTTMFLRMPELLFLEFKIVQCNRQYTHPKHPGNDMAYF